MGQGRVIYQNWIVDVGADPSKKYSADYTDPQTQPNRGIIEAVREALKELPPLQRRFVEQYFYMGRPHNEISRIMGLDIATIEGIHRQAIKSLKIHLSPFVKDNFNVNCHTANVCPICSSSDRREIDLLIKSKKKEETWKKIIRCLKEEFDIEIKTPQVLIGHQKYHMSKEE